MRLLALALLICAGAASAQQLPGAVVWIPPENFSRWNEVDALLRAHDGVKLTIGVTPAMATPPAKATLMPWIAQGRIELAARIDGDPALTLIEQPNPLQSGTAWTRARAAWIQINGNAYTHISTVGKPGEARKGELWNLIPTRVKVVPDPIELVAGYKHDAGGLEPQFFEREAIMHSKLFSADNDFYGLSLIAVIMRQVITDNEAVQWNYHLLKNSGRPPGVLSIPSNAFLSEPQKQEMLDVLDELQFGSENAGRWHLGYGGMKFEKTGFAPAEMEWLAGRKQTRAEIAIEIGVAPELIGDGENKTFSNYKEARKALYMEQAIPMLDEERADRNRCLAPRFGDRLFYDYDRDQIEALQEDRAILWDRIERSTFLSYDEKRAAVGYEPYQPEAKNPATWVYISSAMVPLQDAGIMGTIDDPRNPVNHQPPDDQDPQDEPDDEDE